MKAYFVIIIFSIFSVAVYSDVIIGISNGADPELFEINTVSGVVTSIGTVDGAFASFSGLANVGGQTFATDIFPSGKRKSQRSGHNTHSQKCPQVL